MCYPVRKTLLPLGPGQAAGRVAGHHIALAQRVAAGIKRFVHFLRQRQPAWAVGVGRVTGEDKAVVLVGGHGLFDRPSEPKASQQACVRSMPRRWAVTCSSRSASTSLRWLISSVSCRALHALPQQVAGKLADLARQVLQRGGVRRGTNLGAQLLERQALQRKQVALGHDVDNAPLVRHRHMADAVARHQQRSVLQRVVHRQAMDGAAHDLADGRVQWQLWQRHAAQDVVPRQDAQRRRRLVQHQHRADTPLVHLRQRLRQRCGGRAGQRLPPLQAGQARFQRLLGQGLRSPVGLRGATRQVQKVRHLAVQEIGQRRAGRRQRRQRGHREGQAEAVFVGGVGGRDRTCAHGRAHREQVAGRVFKRPRHFGQATAARDAALADVQQLRHGAAGRVQHHFVGCVVTLRAGGQKLVHLSRLHLGKGHHPHQFIAQVSQQAGRRRGAGGVVCLVGLVGVRHACLGAARCRRLAGSRKRGHALADAAPRLSACGQGDQALAGFRLG
jgi:hypothetical protein